MELKNLIIKFIYFYLRIAAKIQLKKNNFKIIGVTGTAGKSTIVLSTYSILSQKYKVLSTYQKGMGLNSRTGIPFAILGILPNGYSGLHWIKYLFLVPIKLLFNWQKYDYAVLEYGIDVKNEMDDLIKIAIPDIAVWINTGATHAGNFTEKITSMADATRLICHEEAKLIKALPKTSIAIIRRDDQFIRDELEDWMKTTKSKVREIKESEVKSKLENGVLEFSFDEKYSVKIDKYALTLDHPFSFISAIYASKECGVSVEESIQSLEHNLELPKGRNTIIRGKHGSTLIDSSYNSSPEALKAALDLLASFDRPKIAIIGDMRELGDVAKIAHENIASQILKNLNDCLIVTIGELTKKYIVPVLEKNNKESYSFTKAGDAARFVEERLSEIKNAVILIKGSQNTIFTEICAEILMENPEDADKVLTRRGEHWDKVRQPYK